MRRWTTKRNGYAVLRVLAGRSNVFLLQRAERRILVDTSPAQRWRRLQRGLKELGGEGLDALVLTHSHYDHAGSARAVRDTFAARVIVHRTEAAFLEAGTNDGEGVIPRGTGWLTRRLGARLAPWLLARVRFPSCAPDILVEERYDLTELGFDAYLLHTPGHSVGSMSLIVDDELAICGDALFGVFPGRACPPWAVDYDELVRSWGRLLGTGCRLFLPAHGAERPRDVVQREYDRRRRSG